MDVSEALKNTSKGQLNYPKPWEEYTATERKKFLTDITSPPHLPPEVTTHRHTTPATPTTQPDDVSECTRSPSPSGSPSTPPATPQFIENITYEVSPITAVINDVSDYQGYIEDSIMSEVENNMTRWRSYFSSIREQSSIHSNTVLENTFREEELQRQLQEEENEAIKLKQMIEEKLKSIEMSYQDHYQSLKEQIEQNEQRKIQQMNELKQERHRRRLAMVAQFGYYEQQSVILADTINNILATCKYPKFLNQENIVKLVTNINAVLAKMLSQIAEEKQAENPKDEALQAVASLFERCQQLLAVVDIEVQNAEKSGEEHVKKLIELQKEEEEKRKKQEQLQPTASGSASGPGGEQKEKKKEETTGGTNTTPGVSAPASALQLYSKFQEKIEYYMKNTDTLSKSTDPKLKKYRFELQKAVNTPVCAISSQSGVHLAEQIKRLKELLVGHSVSVVGGTVSANDHPEAKLYCMNFLAKKLVKQGEEQISSRPVSAFPIAGVIVHLSCQFPEFIQLFVAHCQLSCPSLVPLYFERANTANESEWRRLQGYKVSTDGAVEKEDLYLKRIGGIIKLYAAVMQTEVVPAVNKPHPYGLENCWTLLARILNMEPRPNITATVLYIVLEVCGSAMHRKFGRQFQKLIQLLSKEYLPKLAQVTPSDHQGPFSRLKMFLEDCLSKGRIPEPEGALTTDFWQSRSNSNIVGF